MYHTQAHPTLPGRTNENEIVKEQNTQGVWETQHKVQWSSRKPRRPKAQARGRIERFLFSSQLFRLDLIIFLGELSLQPLRSGVVCVII